MRVFVGLLFWTALVGLIALLWHEPLGSIRTTSELLGAGSRIAGITGGFVLLAQVPLMSRLRWFERRLGAYTVLRWHRGLGGFVLVAVLAHAALAIASRSMVHHIAPDVEGWHLLYDYPDMFGALVATVILVVVGLLAVRMIRLLLPPRAWYVLHLATYLVLLLSYAHVVAGSREQPGLFDKWIWLGLYVVVFGCLVWGRLIRPVVDGLRRRHRERDEVLHDPYRY